MMLERGERASPLWVKISAYLVDKIEIARQQNDGNLSLQETDRLRGKIDAYKSLLEIGRLPTELSGD